jgi:hypothetical protein
MLPSGMWRLMGLARTNVSEEHAASIFRAEGWRRHVSPKCMFLQDPHGATSQMTALSTVTAVRTSDPADCRLSALCLQTQPQPFSINTARPVSSLTC